MKLPWTKAAPKPEEANKTPLQRLKTPFWRQAFLMFGMLALVVVLIFSMAVAWFTNVTRTNGLQFQTESWGFSEDNITIGDGDSDALLSITLGRSGIVPLSVNNAGNNQAVKAVVNVDKDTITNAEMRSRVYFYVDESKTFRFTAEDDGAYTETVTRQYLGKNRTDSFTYSILAGGTLTLSDGYVSDSPVKWQWVDTLEGYYFRGKVTPLAVSVSEYLRPVEYDLDLAEFDVDEDEHATTLLRVNGVALNDYLQSVLASDGYEGPVFPEPEDPEDEDSVAAAEAERDALLAELQVVCGERTYYRISADEEDNGIWLYLLNADEIAEANTYDTAHFSGDPVELTATVSVTVFNVNTEAVSIESTAALEDALSSPESVTVRLDSDVTLSEPVALSAGEKTIDLNGYNLEYDGEETSYAAFTVSEGSSLTLINGTLVGNGLGSGGATIRTVAVETTGGNAILSGISVSGYDSAVNVNDNGSELDSVVKLTNCTFNTTATSVLCYGNGPESETLTRVILENCDISSGYIGVSGNGSSSGEKQFWGTELIILNSRISGRWAAIYQPQKSSRTIVTGSTLEGYTGVAVKGGILELNSSTVRGTGAKAAAQNSPSGWTDTGDAVYVEAGYTWSASVFVRGTENVLESEHGYLLQLFGVADRGPGKLVSEGGPYLPSEVNWNSIGTFSVSYSEEEEG